MRKYPLLVVCVGIFAAGCGDDDTGGPNDAAVGDSGVVAADASGFGDAGDASLDAGPMLDPEQYDDPGPASYVVPSDCVGIRVQIWGAGGAGGNDGGSVADDGTAGEETRFGDLVAGGGGGGEHGNLSSMDRGGAGGVGSGGTIAETGEPGSSGNRDMMVGESGRGGNAASGGEGGPSVTTALTPGIAGRPPGGGGSGAQGMFSPASGGGGGGYAESELAVQPGQSFDFVVGAGGVNGDDATRGGVLGGSGADGRVLVTCIEQT